MNSDERMPVPAAMSHRQLQKLLQAASVEDVKESQSDVITPGYELQSWADATQHLLEIMASSPESIALQRTPHQVMALGSLRTHMMLGLQALKAAGSH